MNGEAEDRRRSWLKSRTWESRKYILNRPAKGEPDMAARRPQLSDLILEVAGERFPGPTMQKDPTTTREDRVPQPTRGHREAICVPAAPHGFTLFGTNSTQGASGNPRVPSRAPASNGADSTRQVCGHHVTQAWPI